MTVDEVMAEVEKDRAFYDRSGGGLTLSGGEPTFQFDFCLGLLAAAKARGISTCLDTCGHFSPERLSLLLPLVDLWHFDLKATGPEMYRNGTGVDGEQIERNLQHLLDAGAKVRLRCPVVTGIHDRPEHLRRLEALENSGRFETVVRLPYHDTGKTKYKDLNLPAPRFSAG
jgi:pyruvate formate lyase activating enzyme